ncbi:hypothetical protein VTK26DRAFT_7046 [Humicola hyalothermophila]
MGDLKDMLVGQVRALRPSFLSGTPHFNFISAHYLYILALAILGSVILYGSGRGNISYVDALFFASCASTQAGLNPVDLNLLNTFQQVVLYLWPMLTNPITINSFVVFLRLYWFEKRFQHIVREARQKRGTISKSKTKPKGSPDDLERGVNGRKITVMLNGARSRITNDGILLDDDSVPPLDQPGPAPRAEPATHLGTNGTADSQESRRPGIKFAPTATKSDGLGKEAVKLPPSRSDQEHIAILERQRNVDDEVLRIPNPRDVERGVLPKRVEAGDDDEPEAPTPLVGPPVNEEAQTQAVNGRSQAITIEEPDRRKLQDSDSDDLIQDARAAAHIFDFLKFGKLRFLSRKRRKLQGKEDDAASRIPKLGARRQSLQTLRSAFSRDKVEGTPYLSWEPTIGRNSAFPDLTEEQREELGGIEYRSLKTLALILTGYFWGFSALGVIGLLPWILKVNRYGEVVDNAGVARPWWAFYTSMSAFMDLGFTLTPDSMNSFSTAVWPLLLMSFLIVIGNTGFPIMLRFIIWVTSHLVPVNSGLYEELRFLLDHPRRCFTLLFPSGATWWLFWLLVILNGLDVMFFVVLDLGTTPVVNMPAGIKVLNGFFEAVSTRTAGFSCVNLALLHPAVQVSYMIMMYISVFPIAISVRRTNVYEERSLGVYSAQDVDDDQPGRSDLSYVGAHLRRQLSFDLWYIFVGFFILNISEGSKLISGEFSGFAVLFETVSAYGTVGMSLGHPSVNASLCSKFSVIGKLVIVAMVIRGRHRGLPYGLDRAILLPSESLNATEAADADARMARLMSRTSAATGGPQAGSSRRPRSLAGDHGNILTSLLHPGPAIPSDHHREPPPEPEMSSITRRSTDPGFEEGESSATRISSRRTEPGVSRRFTEVVIPPRPRTSGDDRV